jgi:hypothetical protein
MPEHKRRTEDRARAELAISWELVVCAARAFAVSPDSKAYATLKSAIEDRDRLVAALIEQLLQDEAS